MSASKFLSINKRDLVKSLQVVAISTSIPALVVILNEGRLPKGEDLTMIGLISLGAWISYIAKNWLTNSTDEFLKHEKGND